MKKMISLVAVAMMMATTVSAQRTEDLARRQAELNAIHMKMLNAKPSKDAKRQAKELKKEGWTAPAGEKSIEQQITESQLYGAELMTDEIGAVGKRFIMQTSVQTAGTYNTGYAAARANAQKEIAALLQSEIVAAWQSKLDNSQASATQALTSDKFNERVKAVVDETLRNSIPVLAIYRRLSNDNFEVQVRIAYDKKELVARMKRDLQQKLEREGDELENLVEDIICNKF